MGKPRKLIGAAAAIAVTAAAALVWATSAGTGAAAGLADYRPQTRLEGTLRISGNDKMQGMLQALENGFVKYQPGLRFTSWLTGTASGMYGLEMRTADLAAMGRAINPFERYGTYERSWTYPVEIEIATGNLGKPHLSDPLAIFVQKDNPLTQLTLKQVDGIFGAQRGGGWKALSWDEASARPASDDIRRWSQLGQQDAPIHVYGPPILGAGTISFFQARVMGGGAMWNPQLREYGDRRQMLEDLAHDPQGIAYAPLSYATAGVKPLALAEEGQFFLPDPQSVQSRQYPLARPVYLTFTIDNVHSEIADPRIDPKVREFLNFVLSRQGQEIVAKQGDFLPLNTNVVARQMQLLDASGTPPERDLLGD